MRGWGAVLKGEAVGLGSWGDLRCRVAMTSLALQCQPPSAKQHEPPVISSPREARLPLWAVSPN